MKPLNPDLLRDYLRLSSLTPGKYQPSLNISRSNFVGISGGKDHLPILLTGPVDDANSKAQAEALINHPIMGLLLKKLKLPEPFEVQSFSGSTLAWPETCEAIVSSAIGTEESHESAGTLIMINFTPYREISILLCITSELAKIIDPGAPDLASNQLAEQVIAGLSNPVHLQ